MVDNLVIMDILATKNDKLAVIRDEINFPKTIAKARESWKSYEPQALGCSSIGIDGSFNIKQYQGVDLFVVDSVAVDTKNQLIRLEFRHGVRVVRRENLKSLNLALEALVAREILSGKVKSVVAEITDLVLIDGSITSYLEAVPFTSAVAPEIKYDKETKQELVEIIHKNNSSYDSRMTAVFISKNSEVNKQFDSEVGDIFYYNHMGETGPGFSFPFQNDSYFDKFGVIVLEVYARLKSFTPLIKIDLVDTSGKRLTQEQLDYMAHFTIPRLLDKLVYHSVAGYPHCLRLAHYNCVVTADYIERVSRIYGLNNEVGAREALHNNKRRDDGE